jgi:hypothetical protein
MQSGLEQAILRSNPAGCAGNPCHNGFSRNWWHNMLNVNKLHEKLILRVYALSVKHQFLAQVTGPQAFVNALQEPAAEHAERERVV